MSKHLFLVSTESSGDLLGAGLIKELKKITPNLSVSGVGGEKLIAQGLEAHYHIRDFNLMGLFEVLSQIRRLRGVFKDLVERVKREKPDLVLLIDAPDFNLRFAKALKGLGIPIVYYVSPQVWAWRKGRAKKIAQWVDHMIVLFSFEQDIYREYGLETTWVGHPLVDELQDFGTRDAFFSKHHFNPNTPLVALAPGSRDSEVKRLLPVMTEVVSARREEYQFGLPLAGTINREMVDELIGDLPIKILPGEMRPLMKHADVAVVASGTATLETGLLGTPMIVGYRLKNLTYQLAKHLVKVPHIALVNLVLDKRVVPELIQHEFCPEKILPLLDEFIKSEQRRTEIIGEFARLETILGGGGASLKAANVVKGLLSQ